MRTLTTCILLIISCLVFGQRTKVHIDSIPTNLKFERNGVTYNLDFDLCIKNCPDSVVKLQPCRYFLFDSTRTKSEIRRAYRTGVQYFVPFANQKEDQKLNAGYDDSDAAFYIYWQDVAMDTTLTSAFTWRWKIFEDSLFKPWKITQGEHIDYVPQNNIFDDDN